MTSRLILVLGSGALVGLGLWTVVAGLLPMDRSKPGSGPRRGRRRNRLPSGWTARRLAVAAASGTAAGLLTGWPVAAVLTAAGVLTLPALFGPDKEAKARIERLEALATWAEMLRDTLAAAAGLQQALLATAEVAPPVLREPLAALTARLNHRAPLPDALRALADDLEDPVADLMIASLITAAERQARELGPLLGELAAATRARVTMRLRIDAGRARVRTAIRTVTATTLAMAGGLALLSRDYLAAFDSLLGQMMLALTGVLFAAGLAWLQAMARQVEPPRVLRRAPSPRSAHD